MPNALIVVGPSQQNMHITAAKYAAADLTKAGYNVKFANTMATSDDNVLKYTMQQAAPDLLVTFDMAGFDLDILGGDLFYNSLCCPAVHVLFKRAEDYEPSYFKRMNFTMEFITLGERDSSYISDTYFRVPKVSAVKIPENAPGDDRLTRQLGIFIDGDYDENDEQRAAILRDMTKALSANQISYAVCGAGWSKLADPMQICVMDKLPDTDTLSQLYHMSSIVVDTHPERPDICSFTKISALRQGAAVADVTAWNERDFFGQIVTLSRK